MKILSSWRHVAMLLAAMAAAFVVPMLVGEVVGSLPRARPRGNVLVPIQIVVGLAAIGQVGLPWLASFLVLRDGRDRTFFLMYLAGSYLLSYWILGDAGAIEKAWRKGW